MLLSQYRTSVCGYVYVCEARTHSHNNNSIYFLMQSLLLLFGCFILRFLLMPRMALIPTSFWPSIFFWKCYCCHCRCCCLFLLFTFSIFHFGRYILLFRMLVSFYYWKCASVCVCPILNLILYPNKLMALVYYYYFDTFFAPSIFSSLFSSLISVAGRETM